MGNTNLFHNQIPWLEDINTRLIQKDQEVQNEPKK